MANLGLVLGVILSQAISDVSRPSVTAIGRRGCDLTTAMLVPSEVGILLSDGTVIAIGIFRTSLMLLTARLIRVPVWPSMTCYPDCGQLSALNALKVIPRSPRVGMLSEATRTNRLVWLKYPSAILL